MKRFFLLAGALGLFAAAGCCGSHCGYGCYPMGNACAPQCCSYPTSSGYGDTAYYNGSGGTPTVAAAPPASGSSSGIRLKSSPSATTKR